MKTSSLILALIFFTGLSFVAAYGQQTELSSLTQDSRSQNIFQLEMPASVSEKQMASFMETLKRDKSIKAIDRNKQTIFIYLNVPMGNSGLSQVILNNLEQGGLASDLFSPSENRITPGNSDAKSIQPMPSKSH